VYLRLLGRSVDGVGGEGGIVGGVTGAVGNQRLLIPIILALGYNRWADACKRAREQVWLG
jgi:ATP synthase protein I